MLLRRVIEHLRTQNWTAVALDFCIVVIGVFIGIQLGNWNAARADRVRAHAYLERIAGEMDADIANYRDKLKFWDEVYDYGVKGLAYADAGDTSGLSPWRLVVAYFQSSQVAEFYPANSTYEELKSAGELRLIANTELREALTQYYRAAINPIITERPPYRMHVRGVIPLDVQSYIWNHCYLTDADYQRFVDCKSPISEIEARTIADAIAHDRPLMNELRYWASTMVIVMKFGTASLERAEEMRRTIGEELGERRRT